MSKSEFRTATLADWEAAARQSIKGAPLEQLNWVTPEGITVKPLYTAADIRDLPYTDTLTEVPGTRLRLTLAGAQRTGLKQGQRLCVRLDPDWVHVMPTRRP